MTPVSVIPDPTARPRPPARRYVTALLAALLACAAGVAAPDDDFEVAKAALLRAEYVCRFANYVRWPEDAFATPTSSFVIGILGDDPYQSMLDRTVRGRMLNDRPYELRRIPSLGGAELRDETVTAAIEQARACHILCIGSSEQGWCRRVIDGLRGKPVLTVAEMQEFAESGGMIEFDAKKDGTLGFRINRKAAESGRLRMNSSFLKLATIVETRRSE